MEEIEEILTQADNLAISLSIINNPDGSMSYGKYNTRTHEIILNPCQSERELGVTLIHELFHDYVNIRGFSMDRRQEERNAEQYAKEIYEQYPEEINNYLKERKLQWTK